MWNLEAGGMRRERVRTPEVSFHVVTGGAGRAVVFLGGFPQSCFCWRRVLPLLAGRYRVVAADLPGQGDSSKPEGGFDTATAARRVRDLLDALGVERCALVGHDIGAWVSYPFAAQFPERLDHLTLVDANIPGLALKESVRPADEDAWRSWHFFFNRVPDLPEALLAGKERLLLEWFFRNKTANPEAVFDAEDLEEYARVYRMPGTLRSMLGYYRAVGDDIAQNREFSRVRLEVPTLVVTGSEGSSPELAEAMRQRCARMEAVVLPACGHYVPEEQPEALAEAIDRGLRAQA